MSDSYDVVDLLTNSRPPSSQRERALRRFATLNGWRPSDSMTEHPGTESLANGHLIVEHGLQNAAVITFLQPGRQFSGLGSEDKIRLLTISYNNLIDWHLFPDTEGLTFVYNLKEPITPKRLLIEDHSDLWRAEAFDKISGRRPNPNLKNLDDALIETLSLWKRRLRTSVGEKATNEAISALFNSILLVRALEDYWRCQKPNEGRIVLETWARFNSRPKTVRACIKRCLRKLSAKRYPLFLFDEEKLRVFDSLDSATIEWFLRDFYDNKFAPYKYDFSLISKHALSRIYEHYVSLLRYEDKVPQLSFLPQVPAEVKKRTLGEIYTPQYIARFFGRFLRDNLTPLDFRKSKIADPACGSGIFLRTVLEMQCDPYIEIDTGSTAKIAFQNVLGIDIDANACQATRLSLSLLYLILVGRFPRTLNIESTDAIQYYMEHPELESSYDVVISNPPFVKWDLMSNKLRDRVVRFLNQSSAGKLDLFLAFLKLGLLLLKPGGFLLYVLPHNFLIARNAASLRRKIHEQYWVRFLADLSEISVFDEVGVYVLLLVLQKKPKYRLDEPKAVVVRCKEFVGQALQDALDGKRFSTNFYDIFEVNQSTFSPTEWHILQPRETRLKSKLLSHSPLDDFLVARQGFITGADDIFIRDRSEIPPDESDIYVPYLSDREMARYSVPVETFRVVFFPYFHGKKVEADQLHKQFPQTWKYLQTHASQLKNRKSVLSGKNPWWRPIRPRSPETMLRPKIVSPHLIILPKFSIDIDGQYAISRAPLLYPIASGTETEFLYYFLGILNSSITHWQLAAYSHKYSRGYLMLELATLRKVSVPNPGKVPGKIMKRIQFLTKTLIEDPSKGELDIELDKIVADLYALTKDERIEVGMEG